MLAAARLPAAPRLTARALLTAAAAALIALGLYLRTLHPGVGPSLDSMELQIAVLVDGVIHPPGSPQYLLLGRLAMALLPGPNAAFRLNLFSALAGAAAVGVTLLLAYRLAWRRGHETAALAASAFAALSLSIAPRLWYQSSIAELYALNALYVALVLYLLVAWNQSRRPAAFWAAAAVTALSLGHHASMILLLPACLYAVWATDRGLLRRPRVLLALAAIAGLAALQYAIIPLRVAANPPFCNFCPSGPALPSYLTGGAFRRAYFALPRREIMARLPESIGQFNVQFMPWGYALGIVGLWEALRRRLPAGRLLALALLAEYLFVIAYAIPDWHDFLTPCYVAFAPLAACGVMRVREAAFPRLRGPAWLIAPAAGAAGAVLLAVTLLVNLPLVDQRDQTAYEVNGRALLAQARPGAWLLMPHPNSAAFYYSWAVRYLAFEQGLAGFSAVAPAEVDPPPGPPPAYLAWTDAAPALTPEALAASPRQLFVLDPGEARVADYGLLPVCAPGAEVIAGYEVVAVRQGEQTVPLVGPERWAQVEPLIVFAGQPAACP